MPKFACPYDGKNTKEQLACFVFWHVTLDELEQRVVVGRSAFKLETKAAATDEGGAEDSIMVYFLLTPSKK